MERKASTRNTKRSRQHDKLTISLSSSDSTINGTLSYGLLGLPLLFLLYRVKRTAQSQPCERYEWNASCTINEEELASFQASYTSLYTSLVPRPSIPPVFDCLQYAFCILQAIKNWRCRRPGNKARKSTFPLSDLTVFSLGVERGVETGMGETKANHLKTHKMSRDISTCTGGIPCDYKCTSYRLSCLKCTLQPVTKQIHHKAIT